MTMIFKHRRGFEVWAHFDESAEVYELFASEDGSDYLGCADTLAEARKLAPQLAEEHYNL